MPSDDKVRCNSCNDSGWVDAGHSMRPNHYVGPCPNGCKQNPTTEQHWLGNTKRAEAISNDGVCVWRKSHRGQFSPSHYPACGELHFGGRRKEWKHCPYCGLRILEKESD